MTEADFKKACNKLKKKYNLHSDVLKKIEKKEEKPYEEINSNYLRCINCEDPHEMVKYISYEQIGNKCSYFIFKRVSDTLNAYFGVRVINEEKRWAKFLCVKFGYHYLIENKEVNMN